MEQRYQVTGLSTSDAHYHSRKSLVGRCGKFTALKKHRGGGVFGGKFCFDDDPGSIGSEYYFYRVRLKKVA